MRRAPGVSWPKAQRSVPGSPSGPAFVTAMMAVPLPPTVSAPKPSRSSPGGSSGRETPMMSGGSGRQLPHGQSVPRTRARRRRRPVRTRRRYRDPGRARLAASRPARTQARRWRHRADQEGLPHHVPPPTRIGRAALSAMTSADRALRQSHSSGRHAKMGKGRLEKRRTASRSPWPDGRSSLAGTPAPRGRERGQQPHEGIFIDGLHDVRVEAGVLRSVRDPSSCPQPVTATRIRSLPHGCSRMRRQTS